MTFEQYVNKLSELNQSIEGIQVPTIEVRIFDFLLTVLGFVCVLIFLFIVMIVIALVVMGIGHLFGIDKKIPKDDYELSCGLVSLFVAIGLCWMMVHGASKVTPFDSDRYNKELNVKFEQTTKLVYNQLIEMSDDEFSQLAKANKSYALSDEQFREYRVVRQLIQEAKKNRKD